MTLTWANVVGLLTRPRRRPRGALRIPELVARATIPEQAISNPATHSDKDGKIMNCARCGISMVSIAPPGQAPEYMHTPTISDHIPCSLPTLHLEPSAVTV